MRIDAVHCVFPPLRSLGWRQGKLSCRIVKDRIPGIARQSPVFALTNLLLDAVLNKSDQLTFGEISFSRRNVNAESPNGKPELKLPNGFKIKERQNGHQPRDRKNRDCFPVAPKQSAQ